ncbi:hypothetical protein DFJ73DRAFT_26889 [Zopfochytrium polystomum]|nr:hypothetical protein DFJ73DRAFT_26889 [Zopfochytrium polystomum]
MNDTAIVSLSTDTGKARASANSLVLDRVDYDTLFVPFAGSYLEDPAVAAFRASPDSPYSVSVSSDPLPASVDNKTLAAIYGPASDPAAQPVRFGFTAAGPGTAAAYAFGGAFAGRAANPPTLWRIDASTPGAWRWVNVTPPDPPNGNGSWDAAALSLEEVLMHWVPGGAGGVVVALLPYADEARVGGVVKYFEANASWAFVAARPALFSPVGPYSLHLDEGILTSAGRLPDAVVQAIAVGAAAVVAAIVAAAGVAVVRWRRRRKKSRVAGAAAAPADAVGRPKNAASATRTWRVDVAAALRKPMPALVAPARRRWDSPRQGPSSPPPPPPMPHSPAATTDRALPPLPQLTTPISPATDSHEQPDPPSADPPHSTPVAAPATPTPFSPPPRTVTLAVAAASGASVPAQLPSYAEALGVDAALAATDAAVGAEGVDVAAAGRPRAVAVVVAAHVPVGKDEMELRVGDRVELMPDPSNAPTPFVRCHNLDSGRTGLVPRSCLLQPQLSGTTTATTSGAGGGGGGEAAEMAWWRAQAVGFRGGTRGEGPGAVGVGTVGVVVEKEEGGGGDGGATVEEGEVEEEGAVEAGVERER